MQVQTAIQTAETLVDTLDEVAAYIIHGAVERIEAIYHPPSVPSPPPPGRSRRLCQDHSNGHCNTSRQAATRFVCALLDLPYCCG